MFKLNKDRIGEEKIDSGSFGTVFPYQRGPDDLKWVVKRVHANDTDEVLKSFPEIVLGFSCDHPCIVPLKGYHIEKGPVKDYYVYLKFPRMKESLEDRFKKQESAGNQFSEQEIVEYFYSLVCAVDYLHAKKIYHRDIKPDNILLDHQGKAKLCDIGLAKYVGEEEMYQKLSGKDGALMYTAPELLKYRQTLTKESLRANDVWSLGLVILQLCLLTKSPFGIYPVQKKILDVQKKLKKKYAEKLVDLIFGLLKLDPNERMKIADVKKKLEEEYSYCKSFEISSEKDDEYHILKENKRRLEENCKNKTQEMRVFLELLKEENLKLKNELKEYQPFLKKLQFQIVSEVGKHYDETIERLQSKNESLIDEVVQKNQELEKRRGLEEKCKNKSKEMMTLVDSLQQENLNLQNELKEFRSSFNKLHLQIISDISKRYNETIKRLEDKNESFISDILLKKRKKGFKSEEPPPIREISTKCLLVGSHGSGKRSFLKRFFCDAFYSSNAEPYDSGGNIITPGKVKFKILFHCVGKLGFEYEDYCHFTEIGILLHFYDISDKQSFFNLQDDISFLESRLSGQARTIFLLGAKSDLESQRQVTKLEAQEYAKEIGATHLEVSAKTGENFWEFREELRKDLLVEALRDGYSQPPTPTFPLPTKKKEESLVWEYLQKVLKR